MDLFLYDLKLVDDEEHLKYTGVSNRSIGITQMLLDMGRGNDVILRFPVITGITDTEENVNGLVEFVSSLKGLNEIDLLPFHDVSEKFKRLDAEYKMTTKAPTKQKLKAIKENLRPLDFTLCLINQH